MKHVMIDIETLATTWNAAIVSIGACTFEIGEAFDLGEGTKWAGEETFIVGIDPEFYDSVTGRFKVDPKAEAWWAKQSKEAKDSLKINQVQTLPLALDGLYGWMEEVGFIKSFRPWKDAAGRVWANPPSFDLTILRNGAEFSYGSTNDTPWHYRQETCCRTHRALFPQQSKNAQDELSNLDLVAHRADHDAVRQARVVQFIEGRRNR